LVAFLFSVLAPRGFPLRPVRLSLFDPKPFAQEATAMTPDTVGKLEIARPATIKLARARMMVLRQANLRKRLSLQHADVATVNFLPTRVKI
jgi:hypothetical protein